MTDAHTPHTLSDWLGYLSHAEIEFLARLANSLPSNPTVVNIGAGIGTSALTFLSSRPDLALITIDIEPGIQPWGGLENERLILEASGVDYSKRYTTIAGDSKVVGRNLFELRNVDLVFIDGDHTHEGCKGDIEAWLPILATGGIIAVHDYKKVDAWARLNPEAEITAAMVGDIIKPYPGVDRAVDELLLGRYLVVDTVYTLIAFIK